VGVAPLDNQVLSLDVAELAHPFHESAEAMVHERSRLAVRRKEADAIDAALLGNRGKREERNDGSDRLAAIRHYSMTSFARTSMSFGTVRPMAFAVFMLMMSSKVAGCSMGSSPGFAPRRIFAT